MLARGDTWAVVVAKLGVAERTVARWSRIDAFAAEVARGKREIAEAVKAEGIARQQNRIDEKNVRWEALRSVRLERAGDETLHEVPGGKSGLIVRTLKVTPGAAPVEEFAIDTGYLKAMLDLENSVGKELGQIIEKSEVSGDMIVREYVGVDVDRV